MKAFAASLVGLLGLDVLSKILALHYVPFMLPKVFGYPYGGISMFECLGISFSLNTVVNSGAAWGLFQGYSGLLFSLRVVIIAALIVYLVFFNKDKISLVSLGLVATGAIGNGIDYLAYGHVIDFFHFCFWGASFPIFNFADCYITLGALALLVFARPAKLRRI